MKVALINSTDVGSGAANACFRLSEALISAGMETSYIVQKQKGDSKPYIHPILTSKFSKIPYLLRKTYETLIVNRELTSHNFSIPLGGNYITDIKQVKDADVIHVHWFNDCFLSLRDIANLAHLNKPLFFTLHDMWLFTGGCHYSGDCTKYLELCNTCPVLHSKKYKDESFKIFEQKLNRFPELDFKIITPSKWLAGLAADSRLLSKKEIHAVPNCIDTGIFKPLDKTQARQHFDIPDNKFNLLFGAIKSITDKRKGYIYLKKALLALAERNPENIEKIRLLIFGANEEETDMNLPFEVKVLGKLSKETDIVACYNAADAFVIPSLEDNLPNTIMEALACGIPSIGFNTGGIPEMIDHLHNGFLAESKNSTELAEGIEWVMNQADHVQLLTAARQKCLENYSYPEIAGRHISCYKA